MLVSEDAVGETMIIRYMLQLDLKTETMENLVVPDVRVPGGLTIGHHPDRRFDIYCGGLDLAAGTLAARRGEGWVEWQRDRVTGFVLPERVRLFSVSLSLKPLDAVLRHYNRIRDVRGEEWLLTAGAYPTEQDPPSTLAGEVHTRGIGGFAAAMGHAPPDVFFTEASGRRWRLLGVTQRLPKA